jgi:hypothetical protein
MLPLDPLGETGSEALGECAPLFAPCAGIGGDDDGSEVAQVDRVQTGFGGLGAVVPVGDVEGGVDPLAEGEEEFGWDLGLAGVAGKLVLPGDLCTEAGKASADEDATDTSLVVRQCPDCGIPVGPARAQAWRLRTCGRIVASRPVVAPVAVPPFGRLAIRTTLVGTVAIAPCGARPLAFRLAIRAALAVPLAVATTLASVTVPVVEVAAAPTADEACRDVRFAAPVVEELEEDRCGAFALGWQNGRDGHAVEELFRLHTQDVAHRCGLGEQGAIEGAAGLPGACGTPCPGSVVAGRGEFDLYAGHG